MISEKCSWSEWEDQLVIWFVWLGRVCASVRKCVFLWLGREILGMPVQQCCEWICMEGPDVHTSLAVLFMAGCGWSLAVLWQCAYNSSSTVTGCAYKSGSTVYDLMWRQVWECYDWMCMQFWQHYGCGCMSGSAMTGCVELVSIGTSVEGCCRNCFFEPTTSQMQWFHRSFVIQVELSREISAVALTALHSMEKDNSANDRYNSNCSCYWHEDLRVMEDTMYCLSASKICSLKRKKTIYWEDMLQKEQWNNITGMLCTDWPFWWTIVLFCLLALERKMAGEKRVITDQTDTMLSLLLVLSQWQHSTNCIDVFTFCCFPTVLRAYSLSGLAAINKCWTHPVLSNLPQKWMIKSSWFSRRLDFNPQTCTLTQTGLGEKIWGGARELVS